jgi:3-deoxy-7-phosphoheptulonate synthase
MRKLPKFIENLVKEGQLKHSVDADLTVDWPWTRIAGPCSVEGGPGDRFNIVDIAKNVKDLGANALRGGAYKPCTYPVTDSKSVGTYSWKEGLRLEGLKLLDLAKKETGLPIVTEIMHTSQLTDETLDIVDIIQVGARNAQNYDLLDALGHIDKPVLLKRGLYGQIEDILGACERIMVGGNQRIAICPRGVGGAPSTRHLFDNIWAPDLMVIPALKELTNIPVIYDPSHACGYRNFVPPIAKAALAAGAHGLIIETHPIPDESISDPNQAIDFETLKEIYK